MDGSTPILVKRISSNLISANANFLAAGLAVFALTPVYVFSLGPTLFGFWSVLLSILAYMSTFDAGLPLYITRTIAGASGDPSIGAQRPVLATAFTVYLAICLLLLAAAAAAGIWPSWSSILPEGAGQDAAVLFLMLALYLGFSYLSKFFTGICNGHHDYAYPNYISVLTVGLQAAAAYALLAAGHGLRGLVLSYALAGAVNAAIKFGYCRQRYGPLELRLRWPQSAVALSMAKFCLGIFVTTVGGQIILNTDNLLIARMLSLELVTAYAINFQIVLYMSLIFQRLPDVLFPTYAGLDVHRDRSALCTLFIESSVCSLAGYAGFALLYALFAERFFEVWIGASHFVGRSVAWVILAFFFCQTFIHSHAVLLLSKARLRQVVAWNIAEALLNVMLSVAFAAAYGVLGVAIGSLLANLATNFIALPLQIRREIGLPIGRQLRAILMPIAPPLALLLAAGSALRGTMAELSGPAIIGCMVIASLTYAALVGMLLGRKRRQFYYTHAAGLFGLAGLSTVRS
ncbi:MAG: hypothetical protein MUD16_08440 [Desulfobacterales bacterium]|jgi:O-antigen/teichoic acid export membrane protein|nr:hypothetical protein [Desulfobacterales bacterium]